MHKPFIFILNSPPRSGKDTVVDTIMAAPENYQASHLGAELEYVAASFKQQLIAIALLVSGVSREEWDARYVELKDEPWDRLGNLSQRQYLIKISEDWVKPVHGESYFGDATARIISNIVEACDPNKIPVVLIPDGGFVGELLPVLEEFGASHVNILQWDRDGTSFQNDSRDYINYFPNITMWVGSNDGDILPFVQRVFAHMKHCISGGQS